MTRRTSSLNSTLHGAISLFKLDHLILICFSYFSAGVVTVSVSSPSGTTLVTSMLLSRTVLSCESLKYSMSNDIYSSNYFVSAKMEAQENDLPPSVSFRVSGFPTLKFKRAGSRDFIDYEGDRSYESLISFIEEHAKNSLVLPETPKTEEHKTEEHKTEEPKTDEAQVPLEVEKKEKVVAHEEL